MLCSLFRAARRSGAEVAQVRGSALQLIVYSLHFPGVFLGKWIPQLCKCSSAKVIQFFGLAWADPQKGIPKKWRHSHHKGKKGSATLEQNGPPCVQASYTNPQFTPRRAGVAPLRCFDSKSDERFLSSREGWSGAASERAAACVRLTKKVLHSGQMKVKGDLQRRPMPSGGGLFSAVLNER